MKKLLGYALKVVFAILVLAGSVGLTAVPYRQAVAEFQALHFPGLFTQNETGEDLLFILGLFLLAYGGFYLLARASFNQVLSEEYGYAGIVRFGFGLQMISAILFAAISLIQPSAGSITMKFLIVVALLLPFAIRKLWLMA